MKKDILNIGNLLSIKEQKHIIGGSGWSIPPACNCDNSGGIIDTGNCNISLPCISNGNTGDLGWCKNADGVYSDWAWC